jgi:hypothetical protein
MSIPAYNLSWFSIVCAADIFEANVMKLSAAAKQVINLARKVRTYYDSELPKSYPDYPLIRPGQKGPSPPPEEHELEVLLSSLPADIVYRLALIMYLGRGDFEIHDLGGSYQALKQNFDEPKWAVSQMLGKAPLADYLEEGLAELKRKRIPVDNMPLNGVAKVV